MEDKLFTSVEEECLYWKERCLKVSQERDDAQREFDDFTTESRQLEAELEMTVEQQEKKIRDLNQLVNQLHSLTSCAYPTIGKYYSTTDQAASFRLPSQRLVHPWDTVCFRTSNYFTIK